MASSNAGSSSAPRDWDIIPIEPCLGYERNEFVPAFDSTILDEESEFSFSSGNESSDSEESEQPLLMIPFETDSNDLPEFELGMTFPSVSDFRTAIRNYAVKNVKEIKLVKNEKNKVRAQCKSDNCPWVVYGSLDAKTKEFVVRTFNPEHSCVPTFKCSMITSTILARKYEERIKSHPSWKSRNMQTTIRREMRVNVTVSQCRRAKLEVMKRVLGSYYEEYEKIWDYAQALIESDRDNTVKIGTWRGRPDDPLHFQRMYICFGACKKGFLNGCRKVVGLDGCFSKGPVRFQILTAIGRDANDQMFPIAWPVVEVENTETWDWFLGLLATDLNMERRHEWVLISDQQKGLQVTIKNGLPDAEHRMCARHIYANWAKKHKGGNFKKLFWLCSWSYSVSQYNEIMGYIREESEEAANDLIRTDPKHWCRAFFKDVSKSDSVDNNITESFNNWILELRHLPIITMLVGIRRKIMRKISEKESERGGYTKIICPVICEKLESSINRSKDCEVIWNGLDGYEVLQKKFDVKGNYKENAYVVDLNERKCSCRVWNLSGIPCAHVVSAIFNKGHDPINYVSDCYSKEMHRITYSYVMSPVLGMQDWPKTGREPLKPPHKRKMPGRPKKHARRESGVVPKPASKTKMVRGGQVITCSSCGQHGQFWMRKQVQFWNEIWGLNFGMRFGPLSDFYEEIWGLNFVLNQH